MLKKFKKPLYLLSLFALLGLVSALPYYFCNEDVRFQRFCSKIFRQEVSSDTLTLHYTLARPDNFHITKAESPLPIYESNSAGQNLSTVQKYISALEEIPSAKLSQDNQYTYALLLSYFQKIYQLEQYAYYEAPFSPVNGVHSQFPILLSEYAFRSKADIDDYLAILADSSRYLTSLLNYQTEKTQAGLRSDDLSLTKAARQCSSLLSIDLLESGTHFLQTSFVEKLSALQDQRLLTDEEANQYLAQNNALLLDTLYPAYRNLHHGLLALKKGDGSTPLGLCAYPKGKEYYRSLVQFQTGSDKNITEIKNTLETFLASYRTSMGKLLSSSEESIQLLQEARTTDWFDGNRESILSHLCARIEKDFPPLPSSDTLRLTVKEVSVSLSATSAPAFYLTPPIDDSSSNVIYVNPLSCENALILYTTLAHEGYPGHMYQTVYYGQLSLQKAYHPIRHILNFEGYQEGWALYVEFASYDYLSELAKQKGKPKLSLGYEIEKHNRMMQLCLYSLLDIYIHYEGYTPTQISAFLASMGIADPAAHRTIYEYIANAPGNYLKYFWSYLEILTLKKNAIYLLKDDYSDLWFHKFYLDCGPSDFPSLARALVRKKSLKLPNAF